jgi:PPM family protein phosphatase
MQLKFYRRIVSMKACGQTDKGCKREKNEDSILLNDRINLYIVADGMGGHMLGEVASQTAVKVINETIEKNILNGDSLSLGKDAYVKEILGEALAEANKEIYNYSQNISERAIMGTTVSFALIRNKKIYIVHVGDSRIYRLRKGNFEKLTKDHNKAQELVDAGFLKEEEAENHRSSHILTRALGSSDSVMPSINLHDIKNDDKFLLSTDGLFRVLNTDAVKDIMVNKLSLEEKCGMLIEKTLEGGAPDNVSVIIIEPTPKGLFRRIFS